MQFAGPEGGSRVERLSIMSRIVNGFRRSGREGGLEKHSVFLEVLSMIAPAQPTIRKVNGLDVSAELMTRSFTEGVIEIV